MATTYTTISGEQWDQIAKKAYGDEHYAGKLMEANPDKIEIFQFDAGTVLQVPDLDTEEDGFLPPWRTSE
jgi:phage tail protein X